MRTNELKKLIMSRLKQLGSSYDIKGYYHNTADDHALYPHIVYSLRSSTLYDLNRHDYSMDIDVWYKGKSTSAIDDIMDDIEDLFHLENLPQDVTLPTFFLESRGTVEDQDKTIQHGVLIFTIQNYAR